MHKDIQAEGPMSRWIFAAVRSHYSTISVVAILCALVAFTLAYLWMPRFLVTAYAEIARIHYVESDGSIQAQRVVSATVVARQINANAEFGEGAGAKRDTSHRRAASVLARVPIRSENIEIRVAADSPSSAIKFVGDLVNQLNRTHQIEQHKGIDVLERRYGELGVEIETLEKARNEFDKQLLALSKANSRESLQYLGLTAVSGRISAEIRELQRHRRKYLDAVELIREHPTRLIPGVIIEPASIIIELLFAAAMALVGMILAAAVLAVIEYQRSRRRPAGS